jgi:hypothetical protein
MIGRLCNQYLKVPKCEIFDRSDFHDIYTIKSLREGDFGVKIIFFFNFGVHLGPRNSLCYAQSNFKNAVPSKHAEHTHQVLMLTPEHMGQELLHSLSNEHTHQN